MKRAFTLIELVLVLAVLALLAHLAVASLTKVRDLKTKEMADRGLEEMRGASAKFLSDMGRMPKLTGSGKEGTLAELWAKPEDVDRYALKEAVSSNLCAGVSGEKGVYVPTGWKGPYIKLPMGKGELYDPWGNPMRELDDMDLRRLEVTNGWVVAASHYGESAQAKDKATLALVPEGGSESTLLVNVVSLKGETTGSAEVKWFGPFEGLVTGEVANVSCPGTKVFKGLTPGKRVLDNKFGGKTSARYIELEPGDNVVEVQLP